jgi:anti-anti-sigma regulatory factor
MADPLRREQAALLQVFLFFLIGAFVLGAIAVLFAASSLTDRIVGVSSSLLLLVILVGALMVLRRGYFTSAVVLVVISLTLMALVNMVPTGLEGSRAIFMLLAVPIVLAGLVTTGRVVVLALVLSALSVGGVALVELAAPTMVGYNQDTYDPILTCVTFVIAAGVLSLLVWRFGSMLQLALGRARSREQELEQLRDTLEATVRERTRVLEQTLLDLGQREATLAQTVETLRASEVAVRELSAPIIPVLPGVLIAPLIGSLDDERIALLNDNVLGAIAVDGMRDVIFDVTGVPVVDTQVARGILDIAAAARLLGARTMLVGVRPEVAQTVISLGIDLTSLPAYPTLQQVIVDLLGQRRTARSHG